MRIVDRDFLETNNLQRQVLYDEADVAAGLPKAVAAATKLRRINSGIVIDEHVIDVDATNIRALVDGIDVIVDGTDNFETRYLLNDVSAKLQIPWIYGGCIGAEGKTMTIMPGETPCLRCVFPEPPPPGTAPTCDSAGILAPIIGVIASWQASEALKLLSGNRAAIGRTLNVFEMWDNRILQIKLESLRADRDCPTCLGREFPWLDGTRASHTAVLCGRNAVQLSFPDQTPISLDELARKLASFGQVQANRYLLRLDVAPYLITVFPDGRTIVGGTDDIGEARSVHARYIGN